MVDDGGIRLVVVKVDKGGKDISEGQGTQLVFLLNVVFLQHIGHSPLCPNRNLDKLHVKCIEVMSYLMMN